MKKFGTMIVLLFMALGIMAQESAAELKNAGNEALRNDNYAEAITKYEAYFATGEEGVAEDNTTLYNLANCAYKAKDTEKAMKYYNQCVEKGYKPDFALYYISKLYKSQGDEEKEIETLKQVLSDYPNSKNYKKFLAYVAQYYNKAAVEPYNKGNNVAMEAAGSGDAGIYLSKMKEAIVLWEEAELAFEKTLEVDPANSTAKGAINNMADQKKAYDTYKASLNK